MPFPTTLLAPPPSFPPPPPALVLIIRCAASSGAGASAAPTDWPCLSQLIVSLYNWTHPPSGCLQSKTCEATILACTTRPILHQVVCKATKARGNNLACTTRPVLHQAVCKSAKVRDNRLSLYNWTHPPPGCLQSRESARQNLPVPNKPYGFCGR